MSVQAEAVERKGNNVIFMLYSKLKTAIKTQPSACHAEGRGFESRHSRQFPFSFSRFCDFLQNSICWLYAAQASQNSSYNCSQTLAGSDIQTEGLCSN